MIPGRRSVHAPHVPHVPHENRMPKTCGVWAPASKSGPSGGPRAKSCKQLCLYSTMPECKRLSPGLRACRRVGPAGRLGRNRFLPEAPIARALPGATLRDAAGLAKTCDRTHFLRYPLRERPTSRSSPPWPSCRWPHGSDERTRPEETSHAPPNRRAGPPSRRVTPSGALRDVPIWPTLTPDRRQVLLRALSRLLARRPPAAPDGKEVRDETR
jgi:hypothetical protein